MKRHLLLRVRKDPSPLPFALLKWPTSGGGPTIPLPSHYCRGVQVNSLHLSGAGG